MITFVTFYMALSSERRDVLRKETPSFSVSDDAACWIDLLFRSARHFHPGCRCVLLSDEHTVLPVCEGSEIYRRPACVNDPLWSRLSAERDFLDESDDSSHIVFVDFDILVNGSLAEVFAQPFDVALTYRTHPDMPINGGVILIRCGRREKALSFFGRLLEIYEKNFRADSWWAEQRALSLLIGEEGRRENPPPYIDTEGIRIWMLPVREFNYTPKRTRNLLRIQSSAVLLHFKGSRKPLMRDYWEARHLRRERPEEPGTRRLEIAACIRLAVKALLDL
jgi:hypothetical protein